MVGCRLGCGWRCGDGAGRLHDVVAEIHGHGGNNIVWVSYIYDVIVCDFWAIIVWKG